MIEFLLPKSVKEKDLYSKLFKIHKMAARRHFQSKRKKRHNERSERTTAAPQNASLKTLKATGRMISSNHAPSPMSLGAIYAINTLPVINTVSRQPMAQEEEGPTRNGG